MVASKSKFSSINGTLNPPEVNIPLASEQSKSRVPFLSSVAFIGSWFLIFFVAILYEGLKTVRDQLAKGEARRCAGRDDPSTAA